jgi:alpha-1,3/alpha-1,6-mannosyltransferase
MIAVNSAYTEQRFGEAFPRLLQSRKLVILHPGIQAQPAQSTLDDPSFSKLFSTKRLRILSINRFESSKCVDLALYSLQYLQTSLNARDFGALQLIIAGGYRADYDENATTYQHLTSVCATLGFSHETIWPNRPRSNVTCARSATVLFLPSFSDQQRSFLLSPDIVRCVIYTPNNEHFGIVPLEAMHARIPVVAVNSGGPTETIIHGKTGLLCDATAKAFAKQLRLLCFGLDRKALDTFGDNGRRHVETRFSAKVFAERLSVLLNSLVNPKTPRAVTSVT